MMFQGGDPGSTCATRDAGLFRQALEWCPEDDSASRRSQDVATQLRPHSFITPESNTATPRVSARPMEGAAAEARLKILGDHGQRDLEDRLEDAGHLGLHQRLQLVDDCRKQAQHLRIPAGQGG